MSQNAITMRAKEFETALAALVALIEDALRSYESFGGDLSSLQYRKWKDTALGHLRADLVTTESAILRVPAVDACDDLRNVSENEIGLGKKLDTFRFDFAGEKFREPLESNVRNTVVAASALTEILSS